MIVFGPIPSRRLGQSLGINNIPPQICSYVCSYCQVVKLPTMSVKRKSYGSPKELVGAVITKVEGVLKSNGPIDYLTFVPEGEPTLDINLGKAIELLKPLGIKIAVITNSSLLWCQDVRNELSAADLVSVKIDTVDTDTWRKINHPHQKLKLTRVLDGLLQFSQSYSGKLITETMLIRDVNDHADQIQRVAEFIAMVKPSKAYLAIPVRPPATNTVRPSCETTVHRNYRIFAKNIMNVEYLVGYQGIDFAFTGDVEEDILSITAVHPIREDDMDVFLKKARAGKMVVDSLIAEGKIYETIYENNTFYVRKSEKGGRV